MDFNNSSNNSDSSDTKYLKWGLLLAAILGTVALVTTFQSKLEQGSSETTTATTNTESLNAGVASEYEQKNADVSSSESSTTPRPISQQSSATSGGGAKLPSPATKNQTSSSMQSLNFSSSEMSAESAPSKEVAKPKKISVSSNSPFEMPREKPVQRYTGPNPETVKAIRAQVKVHLKDALDAQRSYYRKHKRYSTDLNATGWLPRQPNLNFKAGFTKAYNADDFYSLKTDSEDPKKMDTDFYEGTLFYHGKTDFRNEYYQYNQHVRDLSLSNFEKYCQANCTANANEFEMVLAAPLGSSKFVDVWTVDSRGRIRLVRDGAIEPPANLKRTIAKIQKPKQEELLIDED